MEENRITSCDNCRQRKYCGINYGFLYCPATQDTMKKAFKSVKKSFSKFFAK